MMTRPDPATKSRATASAPRTFDVVLKHDATRCRPINAPARGLRTRPSRSRSPHGSTVMDRRTREPGRLAYETALRRLHEEE